MKAFCINIDPTAPHYIALRDSFAEQVDPDLVRFERFSASTPPTVFQQMREAEVAWTYPWEGSCDIEDPPLHLTAYVTKDRVARMACFMSHYRLWWRCLRDKDPVLILEDDALFLRPFAPAPLLASPYSIIGINDPRGATRLAHVYHLRVQASEAEICEVPRIDYPEIPQGLAGASAYLMKPEGADAAIKLVEKYGAWPNDALCCKQLMPGMLGQVKHYVTRVQGRRSSLA